MTPIACSFDFLEFAFPNTELPVWHSQVERWYQMDAASYGLCELWSKSKDQAPPGLIFLASPGGCNEMDLQFVKSGAASPAKFVYTLPSTRSSALLQLMNWQGPLFCVQNDPVTVTSALSEAASLLPHEKDIWVIGSMHASTHLAYRMRLGQQGSITLHRSTPSQGAATSDARLLEWLKSNESSELNLHTGWILRRRGGGHDA